MHNTEQNSFYYKSFLIVSHSHHCSYAISHLDWFSRFAGLTIVIIFDRFAKIGRIAFITAITTTEG